MKEKLVTFIRQHRRTSLAVSGLLVGILIFAAFRFFRAGEVQYFTAEAKNGDVQAIVQATGTINAVTTVDVGSQVSGMIAELYADFNSTVKKGELVARIDPAIFRTRVLQAEADLANAEAGVKSLEADAIASEANLEKTRAALREAELNRQRTLELFEQGIASVEQRDSIQIAYETAVANLRAAAAQIKQAHARLEQQQAQVKQRRAQLEQARLDFQHTVIRAPIDGTVIARNVDVGQTVAASLQAPTLFTIAQDLTQMLVYAKTDESDVGKIRVGAEASFKVDSFPKETFRGQVEQIRMNAYQVQNVVTYDTIIRFGNPDRKLLPGMTAYVTIPIASARNVVKIPNGALRYRPELP
ncbi:MAG: efflux RND transporter periplasmic adaptor subunit, partial [Terriglobia bacterium]